MGSVGTGTGAGPGALLDAVPYTTHRTAAAATITATEDRVSRVVRRCSANLLVLLASAIWSSPIAHHCWLDDRKFGQSRKGNSVECRLSGQDQLDQWPRTHIAKCAAMSPGNWQWYRQGERRTPHAAPGMVLALACSWFVSISTRGSAYLMMLVPLAPSYGRFGLRSRSRGCDGRGYATPDRGAIGDKTTARGAVSSMKVTRKKRHCVCWRPAQRAPESSRVVNAEVISF